MAAKKRITKGRRTVATAKPVNVKAAAKALNVDPEWLRTGEGSPQRRLAATPEAEVAAIFRQLQPPARDVWIRVGLSQVECATERQQLGLRLTEEAEKEAADRVEKRRAAREAGPKLSLAQRLELTRLVGTEVEALATRIRAEVAQMVGCDTHEQEVLVNIYLSRMLVLAEALWNIASPEDEFDQDVAALEGLFKYFPETAEA